jgi:hypothetical protein
MADVTPTKCPGKKCGKPFVCGLQSNLEKCWCMDVPPRYAVQQGRCVCPDCLNSANALPD